MGSTTSSITGLKLDCWFHLTLPDLCVPCLFLQVRTMLHKLGISLHCAYGLAGPALYSLVQLHFERLALGNTEIREVCTSNTSPFMISMLRSECTCGSLLWNNFLCILLERLITCSAVAWCLHYRSLSLNACIRKARIKFLYNKSITLWPMTNCAFTNHHSIWSKG